MLPDASTKLAEELRDALAITRTDLARLAARGAAFLDSLVGREPTEIEIYGAGSLLHG